MDKNEIKEKELEEISGGFIPPIPLSAEAPKGVMPVIFASEMDKEELVLSKNDNTDGING